MDVITRRLSLPELTEKILEMAKTGVYRESVFEALRPMASKQQIGTAIAHAKQFGLHSVAKLRDAELGTYYQLDLTTYQSLQHTLHKLPPVTEEPSSKREHGLNKITQQLLMVSKVVTLGLFSISVLCLLIDLDSFGLGLLNGAVSAGIIWAVQQKILQKLD